MTDTNTPPETEIEPVVLDEADLPRPKAEAPADSAMPHMLQRLPALFAPFAALSRWDCPVGIWLLAIPCWIGLFFTRIPAGLQLADLWWFVLFGIGAIAMRGAGCTLNDLMDKDIDAQVARTRGRPLPSGQVTPMQAWIWLGVQVFVGFLVWLCLPFGAKIVALLAIPLVAAYPFMKRVTWWPQAWLGITFNWGVLVAAATVGYIYPVTLILFFGLVLWTIAYDTIYALQDREDDALIGVKSTARLFGKRAVLISFCFHMAAATLIAFAAYIMGAGRLGAIAGLAFLGHGLWQATRLKSRKEKNALAVFKSNVWAGGIIVAAFALAAFFQAPSTAPDEKLSTRDAAKAAAGQQRDSLGWFELEPAPRTTLFDRLETTAAPETETAPEAETEPEDRSGLSILFPNRGDD